jgi:SAM-dependent methyltransferase
MNLIKQLKLESYNSGKIRYEHDDEKRLEAYSNAYNEFFSAVTDHPQFNLSDASYARYAKQLANQITALIKIGNNTRSRIIEMGCGRGFQTLEFSHRFTNSDCIGFDVAIDASTKLTTANATFVQANILKYNELMRDADLVIADQMLEHFHEADVDAFLSNCARAARVNGFVFIGTPNRIWGPHDISGVFRLPEPIGFHLKEYSGQEVIDACLKHNLVFERAIIMVRNLGLGISRRNYLILERVISALPRFLLHAMRKNRALGWANIRFLFRRV